MFVLCPEDAPDEHNWQEAPGVRLAGLAACDRLQDGLDDAVGMDGGHATEINGAVAAETGRAGRGGSEQLVAVSS